MNLFYIIAILITLSASFSYINHKYIKLPTTIGLMLIALLMSLSMILMRYLGIGIEQVATNILSQVDFSKTLMHGMLCFLLFAGALHINFDDLISVKWVVTILATIGVLSCTFITGILVYIAFQYLSLPVSFIYCLLFGALISPTDPISVLAIIRRIGIPKSLETTIAGEALFNDGIGVVMFLMLLEIATGSHTFELRHVVFFFIQEVFGGIVFGILIGWIVYRMLKSVNQYQVEILLTLALVTGGYALATAFHISGPIAIVVAGLLIGNHGRRFAMSDLTRAHLDMFWELIDEFLNAILFVLIGLELLVLSLNWSYVLAGMIATVVVLLSRFASVSTTVFFLRFLRDFSKNAIAVLTWGGLRGGISIALVLSLPVGTARNVLLTVTYIVVVFSILVQGLTIKKIATR